MGHVKVLSQCIRSLKAYVLTWMRSAIQNGLRIGHKVKHKSKPNVGQRVLNSKVRHPNLRRHKTLSISKIKHSRITALRRKRGFWEAPRGM